MLELLVGVGAVGGCWWCWSVGGVGAVGDDRNELGSLDTLFCNEAVTTEPSTSPHAAYTACRFCEYKEADSHNTNISMTKASKQCID